MIRCTYFKVSYNSKIASHGAKRIDIWEGDICRMDMGVFGVKRIWDMGILVRVYGVSLTSQCSRSFEGLSVQLSHNSRYIKRRKVKVAVNWYLMTLD